MSWQSGGGGGPVTSGVTPFTLAGPAGASTPLRVDAATATALMFDFQIADATVLRYDIANRWIRWNTVAGGLAIDGVSAYAELANGNGSQLRAGGQRGSNGVSIMNGPLFPASDAGANQQVIGISAGTGAPSNANGSNGDVYLRSDGGALTTMYQRRAGAWTGIV